MKVKFANKIYEVLYSKEVAGKTVYAVEDEPNHVDWLVNVEVIDTDEESDDEKVRKEIIKLVKFYYGQTLALKHTVSRDKMLAWLEKQGKETSWKPSKEEMDVLYGLAYITNQYDEHKEEVITRLYQDLKREFFNGASYENMFPTHSIQDDVRRRSTIQVLEYARSLDTYNQYGKADIDKNIAWLEKQGKAEVNKDSLNNQDEDERLRETTIAFLKEYADKGYENAVECIDWLKKQGKQKSVWHDENEEPTKGSLILIIMPSGAPVTAKVIEPNQTIDQGERWAYINDLLKK